MSSSIKKLMEEAERIPNDQCQSADHLCVLIHGLWGNPTHLSYLAASLRDKYPEEKLHVLVSKTNSDTFTYDGIDLGAERVTQEIEGHIKDLEGKGCKIRKLSIVGYSLGGLVARYTIGLLCTYFGRHVSFSGPEPEY